MPPTAEASRSAVRDLRTSMLLIVSVGMEQTSKLRVSPPRVVEVSREVAGRPMPSRVTRLSFPSAPRMESSEP